MTDEEFGAFDLQMEFKVSAGANSGIFYLLTSPNDPASGAPLGLEYQILDDERHPDAKLGIDGNRTLASLYDVYPRAKLMTNVGIAPKIDVWQHARIVARADGTVEHWLNGVKVLEFKRGSDDYRAHVAAGKFKVDAGIRRGAEGPHPAAGSRRCGVVPQHQDSRVALASLARPRCRHRRLEDRRELRHAFDELRGLAAVGVAALDARVPYGSDSRGRLARTSDQRSGFFLRICVMMRASSRWPMPMLYAAIASSVRSGSRMRFGMRSFM